jgi:hypothetical protein
MTIEVFKSDVTDAEMARCIIQAFHAAFPGYTANIDLLECDKILQRQKK